MVGLLNRTRDNLTKMRVVNRGSRVEIVER
jgi:hypothetical protein